jgi:hypothetical protein
VGVLSKENQDVGHECLDVLYECCHVNKEHQDVGHECLDVLYECCDVNKEHQNVGHECLDVLYECCDVGNYNSSKPPGDSRQNCTQFGGERNGGLIVKRPLSKFVLTHKFTQGTVEQLANTLLSDNLCIVFSDIIG